MTLFIDNIRLYKRHIVEVKESDRPYVEGLMEKSDLLKLCSQFPSMNFIIFTNLEDTPIDEHIFKAMPKNVLCVSAVNAIAHGGRVFLLLMDFKEECIRVIIGLKIFQVI